MKKGFIIAIAGIALAVNSFALGNPSPSVDEQALILAYAHGVSDGCQEMVNIFNNSDLVLSMEEIAELAQINLLTEIK